ncbi:MAG: ferritin [Calditrichaeota bacterium]|nr:ferritin [Calditrichota bacterium]
MIDKKVQEAINEQIKLELESAYLYYAMAAHLHETGFDGMANWMKIQTQEELAHAAKFFDFIHERDGQVDLKDLSKPRKNWETPLDIFRAAYKHEQFITGKINQLYKIAQEENDYPAVVLLQWFINEQVEEEATASKIVQDLERLGDSGHGLFMMDRELGTRVFTPPAAE